MINVSLVNENDIVVGSVTLNENYIPATLETISEKPNPKLRTATFIFP